MKITQHPNFSRYLEVGVKKCLLLLKKCDSNTPISLNNHFKLATEIEINKKIQIKNDGGHSVHFGAVLIERTETAHIYVSENVNYCWRRLYVAKELSHLLLNRVIPNLREKEPDGLKNISEEILNTNFFKDECSRTRNISMSEICAFYIALEILIPHYFVESTEWNSLSNERISEKLKCPMKAVEARKEPNLHNTFKLIYEKFDLE